MKITIESNQTTVSIETPHDDINVAEIAENLKGLLTAAGYHPRSVDDVFNHDLTSTWFPEVESDSDDEVEELDDPDRVF
tara:strand:+ start:4627 stop:4863 length:237 start_codon:yes stop_codon:yes gene_type:complete